MAALAALSIRAMADDKAVDQGATQIAPPAAASLAGDDPRMRAGAAIYTDTCSACHRASGPGVERLFPKLAKSETVQQEDPSYLNVTVLQGGREGASAEAPTGPAMPSLGWRLSDEQVADVLTYIRNSWGNAAPPVKASDVGALRAKF